MCLNMKGARKKHTLNCISFEFSCIHDLTNTSNYKTHLLLFENSFDVNSLLNQQVVNFFTWHDQIQVMIFVISLYG